MPDTDYRQRLYSRYVSTQGREPTRDDRPLRSPYLDRLVRQRFPKNRRSRIFELGCGAGSLIACLRDAGYENVSGVDGSPEQVAKAERLGIAGVAHADLFDAMAQLGDASKDVIVAFDVVEHLTKNEMLQLAEQVLRVLAPGGVWIIHTVNGESPFFGRVRYGDFTHENVFTRLSLQQALASAGFAGVACYEDTPVIHGVVSLGRAVLWQVVRSTLRVAVASETGDAGRDAIFSQNLLAVASKT